MGVEHTMLRQRSSQLQKYKAARMSRRIAIDQKVCSWDGGHPGWYVQLPREKKIWACVSRYDQSA